MPRSEDETRGPGNQDIFRNDETAEIAYALFAATVRRRRTAALSANRGWGLGDQEKDGEGGGHACDEMHLVMGWHVVLLASCPDARKYTSSAIEDQLG